MYVSLWKVGVNVRKCLNKYIYKNIKKPCLNRGHCRSHIKNIYESWYQVLKLKPDWISLGQ